MNLMRLSTLFLAAFLLSGCTAMMVGGGSSTSTTAASSSETHRASDAAIRAEVRNRLASHPEIGAFDVNVSVSDAVVLLSGEVQSYAAREAAEKIAMNTDGVDSVENGIKVNVSK